MSNREDALLAERAEAIYDERLRKALEQTHHGWFLAIEPESGDHFLARNANEAIQASRRAHPDRLAYCLRVGYEYSFEL